MRNTFGFYPKLAANNIKKNSKLYVPYVLSCVLTATVYYLIRSLVVNDGLGIMYGGSAIRSIMMMGGDVVAVFSVIFLFYTNSFLMRRRQQEFGLFHILGMGKRHIAMTLAYETIYVFAMTVAGGIGFGVLLDKLTYLIVAKILSIEIPLRFSISTGPMILTMQLYAIAFVLIYLKSLWTLYRLNPTELLRESRAGEKEPKAKWLLALVGVATLGAGYYIALTIENPMKVVAAFFPAVILVIIGTYLLFTAGSIVLLKLLRKNKRYYYKTNHFVGISAMMYRMKQNAAGLASICILCTMVLVMLTSTGSLMIGNEDMLYERYPRELNIQLYQDAEKGTDPEETVKAMEQFFAEKNVSVSDEMMYHYCTMTGVQQGNAFVEDQEVMDQVIFCLLPLGEYNQVTGAQETLEQGQVLLHTERMAWEQPTLNLLGVDLQIKKQVEDYPANGETMSNIMDCLYLVVTADDFQTFADMVEPDNRFSNVNVSLYYGVDGTFDKPLLEELRTNILVNEPFNLECRSANRIDYLGLFGGMFFVGVFLGLLFSVATVLIIYYKQISEGYDDKGRFEILQKVGMSQKEVKKAIHSQVLTVFFLPLLFAGLHILVAFPIINKMLAMLGLLNTGLFAAVTVGAYLIFALLYVLIYGLTARSYYQIVRREG